MHVDKSQPLEVCWSHLQKEKVGKMESTKIQPETWDYSSWRHGGWYVHNVRYPSGAVGCVSRNYPDRKWRIVCDPRPGSFPGGPDDRTYPNRDAAAWAEYEIAAALAVKALRDELYSGVDQARADAEALAQWETDGGA